MASRGERWAGAVPVSVTRRWGATWARSLPFGTYGGPLVAGGEPDPAAVRARLAREFADWLESERVGGGEFVLAPGASHAPDPAWAALASPLSRGVTHLIALERGFDAFLAGLKRETRKSLRRAEREGVAVGEEPAAIAEAHALYLAQARGWPGHRALPLPFLRALVDHPSRFARLHVARQKGDMLCAILALSCAGETFLWWSGSAPASRSTLAYPFLIVEILRAAIEAGETRLNVGASGGRMRLHRFKESLGAVAVPYWTGALAPRASDPKLRLLAWARALKGRR